MDLGRLVDLVDLCYLVGLGTCFWSSRKSRMIGFREVELVESSSYRFVGGFVVVGFGYVDLGRSSTDFVGVLVGRSRHPRQ